MSVSAKATRPPDVVLRLVDRFGKQRDDYVSPGYKEDRLRKEFIDPFFETLGWDMANVRGYAEPYKEVVHEDTVKVDGKAKAPDYSFRIGGMRKFFLEAKKPEINVKNDPKGAYQLRRYAWSANLPLSILTNFEEFAVYDGRVKPLEADSAVVARVFYTTFDRYDEKWGEIASVFARDSILDGSFDKYAESNKQKRGTVEVDEAFLSEIEGWRESLARNIALRNRSLNARELNHAILLTIDRIIFLRMCEDRGIERYGQLRELARGDGIYPRLIGLFAKADDRYNSGMFHFRPEKGRSDGPDTLTPGLTIDDLCLRIILLNLYYPTCPYEFSVIPAEILGQAYERFLGKVIRLTPSHRAVVEDKPEVRKAGGIYYTPTYIVDDIVKRTVAPLLEGKSPEQAKTVRILDPSCGSGSFLIRVYQFLLDWYLGAYVSEGPEKHSGSLYIGQGRTWHLCLPVTAGGIT